MMMKKITKPQKFTKKVLWVSILQSVAIFMIMLILSLPFYTSNALAAAGDGELKDLKYYGKDGMPGYLRQSQDPLTVEVKASIEGEELTTEQAVLNLDGREIPFQTCEGPVDGEYYCVYQSEPTDWALKAISLDVILYSKFFQVKDSIEGKKIYVDGLAPTIKTLGIPGTAKDRINIPYELTDTACPNCGAVCSGVDRIELKKKIIDEAGNEGYEVKKTKTNVSQQGCDANGKIETSVAELGLTEGTSTLCVDIYDKMGNMAETCKDVFVDMTPPRFIEESFNMTDMSNNAVNYISAWDIPAKITVDIADDTSGLKADGVYADLSALNSIVPYTLKNVKGECSQVPDEKRWKCTFNAKIMEVNGDLTLTFNASDISNNYAIYQKTVSIIQDKYGPVIKDIKTENAYEERRYINGGSNNTFIAEIDESGIGMYKQDISLNIGGSTVKADDCIYDGTWTCHWYKKSVGGNNGDNIQIAIASAKDDLGNFYSTDSVVSSTFTYDNEKPEFIGKINVTPLGFEREVLLAESGEVVEITAVIKEEFSEIIPEKAFIDFSGFDSTQTLGPAESCDLVEGLEYAYKCVWQYAGPLQPNKQGQTLQLNVIVYDTAGNKAEKKTEPIHIVESKEAKKDMWNDEASVTISYTEENPLNPNFLWMSQSTLIRTTFEITSKGTAPFVHNFMVTSCSAKLTAPLTAGSENTKATSGASEEKSETQSFEVGSVAVGIKIQQHPPLEGKSKTQKLVILDIPNVDKGLLNKTTELVINCGGEITQSKSGSSTSDIITPNEIFNATIIIPLSEGLFSNPGQGTIDKLYDNEMFIDVLDAILSVLDFLLNKFLIPFCTIINSIQQILNSICSIVNGFALAALAAYPPLIASDGSCKLQSDFLNTLWYGRDITKGGQGISGFKGNSLSSKSFISIGYMCDLALCSECSSIWNGWIGGEWLDNMQMDFMKQNYIAGEGAKLNPEIVEAVKRQGFDPTQRFATPQGESLVIPFDPRTNLIIALICSPPCLVGIQTALNRWKYYALGYNKCMNIATIEGPAAEGVEGMGISECDDYMSHAICMETGFYSVGWIWQLAVEMAIQYVTKAAIKLLERWITDNGACNVNTVVTNGGCATLRVYLAFGVLFSITDMIAAINQLINVSWWNSDDDEGPQEEVNEAVDNAKEDDLSQREKEMGGFIYE